MSEMGTISKSPLAVALALIVLLYGVNMLSSYLFNYPFAYCVIPMLVPDWLIVFIRKAFVVGLLVSGVYALFTKRWKPFVELAIAMVVVYTIPKWFDVLTNVGGSCG